MILLVNRMTIESIELSIDGGAMKKDGLAMEAAGILAQKLSLWWLLLYSNAVSPWYAGVNQRIEKLSGQDNEESAGRKRSPIVK